MAVELMMNCRATTFASESEETAAAEAASGLQSVEKLIRLFSSQHQKNLSADGQPKADYAAVADAAVSKFKNVISLLDRTRTGHARFRRGPVRSTASPSSSSSSPNSVVPADAHSTEARIYCPTPIQQVPLPEYLHQQKDINPGESKTISFSYSPVVSRANSFMSSLTSGGGGGGDAEAPSGFQVIRNVSCNSAGKPPLSTSSSFKRKCTSSENAASGKCSSSSGRCQCSKRRKVRVKREIRVPAISMKMSDIPPDDYSWRKYGQKPIKGSPHPRGYYKCSSVRGCPARKHVERAVEDPTMLVVTYEGDHNHALAVETPTALILESS